MKIALALAFTAATLPAFCQHSLSTLAKTGTVDARFQSYNVEMVEVVGGRFWKPYASKSTVATSQSATPGGIDPALFEQRTPIDLSNPRLRKLAAAFGKPLPLAEGTFPYLKVWPPPKVL